MDASALVEVNDLDDGARLVQDLLAHKFSISAAFWAFTDKWQLVIATPEVRLTSRTQAYGVVQAAIKRLNLGIPLSRITVAGDDDPAVRNLRALVEAEATDGLVVSFGQDNIAGLWLDRGFAYKTYALAYGKVVYDSLRRLLPRDAAIEERPRFERPEGIEEYDALIVRSGRFVIVEVKAKSRPLSTKDILALAARRQSAVDRFGENAWLLVVSNSGFTRAAVVQSRGLSGFKTVTWKGPEDDLVLKNALHEILGSTPMST